MDITVLIGLIGGTAMLLLGQALEGGNVGQLLQVTAAMIVFGGMCASGIDLNAFDSIIALIAS